MQEIRKVKTAVIGCGMISNVYIRNLKHLFSLIDLAALCDVNAEAAKEKAALYGVPSIMTVEEIAKDPEIELVVNLTGPTAHYGIIETMLSAGKHVYTEKMLTVELAEGEKAVRLSHEKKRCLGVAPDTVLGAGIQTARNAIDAGFIGQVTSCRASINRNQSLNSETYRFLQHQGGAFPYDIGIYYIAALLCLLGPVRRLSAFGAPAELHSTELLFQPQPADSWQIPGNNLLTGLLSFESGALGTIHLDGNTINEEKHSIVIYGTEGILEIGDPNRFDGYVKLTRTGGGECVLPMTHGYDGRPVLPDATAFEKRYGCRGIGVAEMAWAIRNHRPQRLSGEYGLHCMEVLKGMDESAASGTLYEPKSRFQMAPLPSGYYSIQSDGSRGDAERSLQ